MKLALCLLLGVVFYVDASPTDPSEDEIQVQENFDVTKFLGKWYVVSIAGNCQYLPGHVQKHRGGSFEIMAGEGEDTFTVTSTKAREGECHQRTSTLNMVANGRFFTIMTWKKPIHMNMIVVRTNYNEYAVMYAYKESDKSVKVLRLMSRTQEIRDDLMDEFRSLCLELGLTDEQIFVLANDEECVAGEDGLGLVPHRRVPRAIMEAEEEGSGFQPENKELCLLPSDSGPCFGMFNKFYYNKTSINCESFVYGGCLGNKNRFATENECFSTCRTEAACRLPMEVGLCKARKPAWAFDSTKGACFAFNYGGCKGNANRFGSREECEKHCGISQ
ncbi:protein AMBP-like [Lampetra fluviatilis]